MMATVADAIGDLLDRRGSYPTPLTIEDVAMITGNERRRLVIDTLDTSKSDIQRLTLRDLSETVASAELERPVKSLDSDDRKSVYVALYQSHLPRLDTVDVIDYDKDRGTIERGPAFEQAASILQAVRDECDGNGGDA